MEANHGAVGFCQRLFNFLVDVFLAGSLKRVTLGRTIAEHKAQHSPENEERAKVSIEFFQAIKEGSEVHKEALDVNSTTWTLELGKASDVVSGKHAEQMTDASTITNGEANNSIDKSEGRGLVKKIITIEDGAQEREIDMNKKEEKNKAIVEEVSEPEVVPDKKVRIDAPNNAVPIMWSVFNIDQRSSELIRRTKEAMRSSSGVEARASS